MEQKWRNSENRKIFVLTSQVDRDANDSQNPQDDQHNGHAQQDTAQAPVELPPVVPLQAVSGRPQVVGRAWRPDRLRRIFLGQRLTGR